MSRPKGADRPHLPAALEAVVAAEYGRSDRLFWLCDEFLGTRSYSRSFAARLVELAAGRLGAPWEVRCLGALMLQSQALRMRRGDLDELAHLLALLGLQAPGGPEVCGSALREGYTATGLAGFARQWRRHLGRSSWIFDRLRGAATAPDAWLDFLALARQECKLALARYLFTPEEVVDRILTQVKTSQAIPQPFPASGRLAVEARGARDRLPPFEAEIVRRLAQRAQIYWVAGRTSSVLNALVEYPLGTVVLVIKPPGSGLEIELKRAGRRGGHPLGAVFTRGGVRVPPSHRLDGGSMGNALKWEADACGLLATVYRRVHGREAPMARTASVSSIQSVPVNGRPRHIFEYFTDREVFGRGYAGMRQAMRDSIAAFQEERDDGPPPLPGELGLTVRFLSCVGPSQALLVGSTSYRLDRVALYLSDAGPAAYFGGLGGRWDAREARQLADQVLEEVLGVYQPPAVPYDGHRRYVQSALAVPANRARADRIFRSLLRQIGTFWGTLYAFGGCSEGESFVARNVGLKSVWQAGEWTVRILFMDHDGMRHGAPDKLHPGSLLPAMSSDQGYILGNGRGNGASGRGEVGFLAEIYGMAPAAVAAGRAALGEAARRAYRKTQAALRRDPALAGLFRRSFLRESRHWDALVKRFLAARRDDPAGEAWKAAARSFLAARKYPAPRVEAFVKALEKHSGFLARQSFIYEPGTANQTAPGACL